MRLGTFTRVSCAAVAGTGVWGRARNHWRHQAARRERKTLRGTLAGVTLQHNLQQKRIIVSGALKSLRGVATALNTETIKHNNLGAGVRGLQVTRPNLRM